MRDTKLYTTSQLFILVILRILIGWHLLYEGISKLISPGWSSLGFLKESKWIFSDLSQWIISNGNVLEAVNFLNTWGLIAIGLGLILGLFARVAAFSGIILLLVYYSMNPPLVGLEYSVPFEGNYLIVSKTLIEAVALMAVAVFPTSLVFGLDNFVDRYRNRKKEMNNTIPG